jgi:hypothetical protein
MKGKTVLIFPNVESLKLLLSQTTPHFGQILPPSNALDDNDPHEHR